MVTIAEKTCRESTVDYRVELLKLYNAFEPNHERQTATIRRETQKVILT